MMDNIGTELKLIRMLLEQFLENKDPVEYLRYDNKKQSVLAEQQNKQRGRWL